MIIDRFRYVIFSSSSYANVYFGKITFSLFIPFMVSRCERIIFLPSLLVLAAILLFFTFTRVVPHILLFFLFFSNTLFPPSPLSFSLRPLDCHFFPFFFCASILGEFSRTWLFFVSHAVVSIKKKCGSWTCVFDFFVVDGKA